MNKTGSHIENDLRTSEKPITVEDITKLEETMEVLPRSRAGR